MNGPAALAKIRADIARHKKLFDLERDELGKHLCKAATDGVQECFAGQHSPDGEGWEYLSPKYDEWKSFQFPGNPIGVLHQVMANPNEVAGEVVVTPDKATVTYGISDQARDEAVYFQEGNSHQPERRFWGLTETSVDKSKTLLDARFATA
jgi:hypothetical protein